jgi:hypothetical protein
VRNIRVAFKFVVIDNFTRDIEKYPFFAEPSGSGHTGFFWMIERYFCTIGNDSEELLLASHFLFVVESMRRSVPRRYLYAIPEYIFSLTAKMFLTIYKHDLLNNFKIFSLQYTECHRRNGQYFGRVFLRSNYTDITQNTYIQSFLTYFNQYFIRIPRRIYSISNIGYEFKNKCNAQFISSANIITYFCKIMGTHY